MTFFLTLRTFYHKSDFIDKRLQATGKKSKNKKIRENPHHPRHPRSIQHQIESVKTYSLYELNEFLRRVVALNFSESVWVTAEIGQIGLSRGHY